MSEAFQPLKPNKDLDILESPEPVWARVAVVGRWADARVMRRSWPRAAVVGPLRSMRGLDEFVRNLLANPQIRLVIVSGYDLTPGETTTAALRLLWKMDEPESAAWVDNLKHLRESGVAGLLCPCGDRAEQHGYLTHLLEDVQIVFAQGHPNIADTIAELPTCDRAGGRVEIYAPQVEAMQSAPPGDPGERIVGRNLAEVWPRIVKRIMLAGVIEDTSYGPTRELLTLVSVLRDPAATAEAYSTHAPTLAYAERLWGAEPPEGASYSYGSRLRGRGGVIAKVREGLAGGAEWLWPSKGSLPAGQEAARSLLVSTGIPGMALALQVLGQSIPEIDQIAAIRALLEKVPGTRAAYLTPWDPREDVGKESGRPCLVGVWFRAAMGDRGPVLHMVIAFRSHDMFKGYPENIAAACMWLVREAAARGWAVGTLTCTSYSAHIYEGDWVVAQELVKDHEPRGKKYAGAGIQWDQRSTWVVAIDDSNQLQATALTPGGEDVLAVFTADTPAALREQIDRSGLVTAIGNALWLGEEITRVAASRPRIWGIDE